MLIVTSVPARLITHAQRKWAVYLVTNPRGNKRSSFGFSSLTTFFNADLPWSEPYT